MLTFKKLREANTRRLPQFKNALGEPAHSEPDGSDWTQADWLLAVIGEVGEAAHLLKKVRRGDMPLDEARRDISYELADIVIYLDILAMQLKIDLGQAARDTLDVYSSGFEDSLTTADWFANLVQSLGKVAGSVFRWQEPVDEEDRSDMTFDLGVIVGYLYRVAAHLDIELMSAVAEKFNLVSVRVGSDVWV